MYCLSFLRGRDRGWRQIGLNASCLIMLPKLRNAVKLSLVREIGASSIATGNPDGWHGLNRVRRKRI